jgi:trans-aconitate methyltransferase
MARQTWNPDQYEQNAGFVPALGASILARLAPRAAERILDLGCGNGTLTLDIVASGASVVGVDASPDMVAAARERGIDARVMDATALTFDEEFDAVFSNAVLHWVRDAEAAAAAIFRALKPGGRFVAELGGYTNVASISVAIRAVLARHHIPFNWPWYYPSPDEYRRVLESRGFEVQDIRLFPRPTPLPTGMDGWLQTFGGAVLANVHGELRERIVKEIVDLLRPSLCDERGRWTADYVRLQVVAIKPAGHSTRA